MSKRTSALIVGLVALALAVVTFLAALSIVRIGTTERISSNRALTHSLALSSQSPAGYVAASGPLVLSPKGSWGVSRWKTG